jgi:hypothetical protein
MMRRLGTLVVFAVFVFAGLSITGCGSSPSTGKDKMGGKMEDKMGGKMEDKMGGKMEDKK